MVHRVGGEPLAVPSALTSQPLRGAVGIHPTSADVFSQLLDGVLSDGPVDAVKLGMVAHPDLAQIVVQRLMRLPPVPLVIDPVLASSTGAQLLVAGSRRAVYRELCRLRPILTPNIPELAILTGRQPAVDEAEELRQARQVMAWGAAAILIKGGHRQTNVDDVLITADGLELRFPGKRIASRARGRGCRLASAMAAGLGSGLTLKESIERARRLVREHLQSQAI
jgi:hydroxymethylpyrimidine/phosphomethylpyrimidine kinase